MIADDNVGAFNWGKTDSNRFWTPDREETEYTIRELSMYCHSIVVSV